MARQSKATLTLVAVGLVLSGCQSVASSSTLNPSPSATQQANPGGPAIQGGLPLTAVPVSVSAQVAAPHTYEGSWGGPVSGGALGSERPCPGALLNGDVLMAGKTNVAAVFICPVTRPGRTPSHYTGSFQQVPANRIDALLKALTYRPTSPQSQPSCVVNPPHIDSPLVVFESRNGVYFDISLPPGECPGLVPDDVAKAIDAALAPAPVYRVRGVRGTPAGPIDLGKPCDNVETVHKGPLIEAAVPVLTTLYVCPPATSFANPTRYYRTVPDSKTAAILKALAGPDDHPGGPWWHCTLIINGTGYAVIGQALNGTRWWIHIPTAGCGQPTIAVGKAIDAAMGTHRYDSVKGYGL